jgi:hypothetical protein
MNFNSIRNSILLNYENCKNKISDYRLSILNEHLIVQRSVICSKQYDSVCGNSEAIIGLTRDCQLDIYSQNLKFLKTVSSIQPNYNSSLFSRLFTSVKIPNIAKIEIINKSCILKMFNKIRIVNIDSGTEEASIDIEGFKENQMAIKNGLIHNVVSNEEDHFEIQVFNLKGKLEFKYSLIGFNTDCFLAFNNNNKINFSLNKNNLLLNKY